MQQQDDTDSTNVSGGGSELAPPIERIEETNGPSTTGLTGPSTSNPDTMQEMKAGPSQVEEGGTKVFVPPESSATTPSDLDPAFFEPTLSDVQAHHASVVARSKRLNEAPLLTSKFRDADQAEKEKKKAERWPNTTIRVKFSDGTQIQHSFPSSSPIQPVYEFVRSSLDPSASTQPFVLWQPPRYQYPEHPIPSTSSKKPNPHRTSIIPPANYGNVKGGPTQGLQGGTGGKETLAQLGLVPQSVLLVRWSDESMNASGFRAPLKAELLEKSVPLPSAQPKQAPGPTSGGQSSKSGGGGSSSEKKIPKWLQKGLMKKK